MSQFLAILTLIAINAFFVTAEFAVVSVRRTRIQQLVLEGDDQARTVQNLQRDLNRLLSTTQIGITLSSLALGWIGEQTMVTLITSAADVLPVSPQQLRTLTHTVAIPGIFLLIAYLQIVLGELCPKALALQYAEPLAKKLGPLSLSISRLLYPCIWILNQSTRFILDRFGIPFTDQDLHGQLTTKELQLILEASSGLLAPQDAEERRLLQNVVEFGEGLVEEVMVPRTSIDAISEQATYGDFLAEMLESGHQSYPVISESLDHIRGVVRLKDFALPLARGEIALDTPIKTWVQTAWFVTEGTPTLEALQLMQKYQLAIVMVRERDVGGTAGLVHLRDLLAEIIPSSDESGYETGPEFHRETPNSYLIQAQTPLESVNTQLSVDLPMLEDYQTLGGFLLYMLQKVPNLGDSYCHDNIKISVVSQDGPRLDQLRLTILPLKLDTSPSPVTLKGAKTDHPVQDSDHESD
jgi:CBS domain containing-hemolysin-like protein